MSATGGARATAASPPTREPPAGGANAPPPRQLLPRQERHEAILRGAAGAFATGGYAATSMEDVAAASGITKLIVYRHFDSKEDLYEAVLRRTSALHVEEIVAAREQDTLGPEGVRVFLNVAREDPNGFRLLWRHASREAQFASHADRFRELAIDVTRTLLEPVVADRALLAWAARFVVAFLVDAVLAWLDEGDPARDEEFVRYVTGALESVATRWAEEGPR